MRKWKPKLTRMCDWRLMQPYFRTYLMASKQKSPARFGPASLVSTGVNVFQAAASAAERQILFYTINVGWPKELGFAQRPAAFGIFVLKQMALAGASEHHFAGGGQLEAFCHGLSCF